MRSASTFIAALMLALMQRCADGQPPTPEPASASTPADVHAAEGYRIAWSDEFTADGPPDPANWTHERGFVRNQELQWYQEANARCTGGMLVIEGRRERLKNPRYRAASRQWGERRDYAEYTSASIKTQGLHSWQYGRFEMRARIDVRPGLWPAWWALGVDGGWPACGEIDMMEYYRGQLLANAAWASRRPYQPHWDDMRVPLAELGDKWAESFHKWRMDWDEHRIAMFVDGRLLNEVDLDQTINEDRQRKNPFRQPHYMILNLAIGGANGGDPGETRFPAKFEVDWVRVYQK